MKTKSFLFLLTLGQIVAAQGQTLKVLGDFGGSAGSSPQAGLLLSGHLLYGTTFSGVGSAKAGAVFSINTNGAGLAPLHVFNGTSDGKGPVSDLVQSGNLLYGTTSMGGAHGFGGVFSVNITNGVLSNFYSFTGGADGSSPEAGIVLSNNAVFGTAFNGGLYGYGSVFRVNTDGTSFTNLHSFTGTTGGANPQSKLVLAGSTLFGTTSGSQSGNGTVFAVNADSTGFTNLHAFANGADGANPEAGLLLLGNILYGTAYNGGGQYVGTIFSISTNGTNFQSYPFNGTAGANPQASLYFYGHSLYGTASAGGVYGWGTVFQFNLNGNYFTNFYSFTNEADGGQPEAPLILAGTNFFGTTENPNGYGSGNVFSFNIPDVNVPLNIALNGANVVLSWTNATFGLQGTSNLNNGFTNIPSAASPYSTPLTNAPQFFRLIGN